VQIDEERCDTLFGSLKTTLTEDRRVIGKDEFGEFCPSRAERRRGECVFAVVMCLSVCGVKVVLFM